MSSEGSPVSVADPSGDLDGLAPVRRPGALRKTQSLQAAVFEAASSASIATDADGIIHIFNAAAERMLGYTAAELTDKVSLHDLCDAQDVVQRAEALSTEFMTPVAADFEALSLKASRAIEDHCELTFIRKDGSRCPVMASVVALRDVDDTVIGYLLIGAENTARHQTAEALLQTEALRAAIFNSAMFSKIATDARGVIQIFNVGAERMLGYAADDVTNKITPADMSDPLELIARANALSEELGTPIAPGFETLVFKASRGIEDIYELTYVRKDGSRFPAVVSVTALRDRHETIIGYLLIGSDNTARQHARQALQESNAELAKAKSEAEKANLAKSDFLSSMSHELRSPLNAILGFAQLIESGSPLPTPGQKDCIDQILQAGWYLLELINEILDLSLIESGKLSLSPECISLAEVLDDCESMIEPLARKGDVRLKFSLSAPCFVKADRTRVKQVFINLLSNAIKYNRSGGTVEVTCSEPSPQRTRVSFRDTGQGLAPDKLEQLFQPFNRLGQESGNEEGTGIGLVVSKRLVELMGGGIGVDSEVGVGSVFWIELDSMAPQEMMSEPTAFLPSVSAERNSLTQVRTVLCVEDNPANLLLIDKLIARRGDVRMLSARDGMGGFEMARAARPDVILMDINLPGINGLQALRLLSKDTATSRIPVIALSANAMPRDVEKGLEAGFFRYLTKPIKVDEFMTTLDAALKQAEAIRDAPEENKTC